MEDQLLWSLSIATFCHAFTTLSPHFLRLERSWINLYVSFLWNYSIVLRLSSCSDLYLSNWSYVDCMGAIVDPVSNIPGIEKRFYLSLGKCSSALQSYHWNMNVTTVTDTVVQAFGICNLLWVMIRISGLMCGYESERSSPLCSVVGVQCWETTLKNMI